MLILKIPQEFSRRFTWRKVWAIKRNKPYINTLVVIKMTDKRKYISTSMATDWPEKEPWQIKVLKNILFFIPKANQGYDPKMHLVKKWLIEFEVEDGKLLPWREIGLDSNGTPVLAGPDKKNYGFWLDSNMEFADFEGEPIDKDEFEKIWKTTGVEAIKIDNESD